MAEPQVIGLNPALPRPLARWAWWTAPVRAERLAALRIGVALVLLFDVLGTYVPQADVFFGTNSLGSPEVFAPGPHTVARWCAFRSVTDPDTLHTILLIWAGAAAFLLVGLLPNVSALVAWALSVSVIGVNSYLHNSGDNVRTIELFYLMLCPCAAAWSLQACCRRSEGHGPVYVPAWPLRLLFIQMVLIYFVNGVYKLSGLAWRDGNQLHYVLENLAWTRFSASQFPLPNPVIQILTWTTLFWEVLFPILVLTPRLRALTLWLGVAFHIGTAVFLQLGPFPFYMICLYLPLVPWERYVDWRRERWQRTTW
jgi:Vitamin K-dependent gamma-carboxylase